MTLVTVERKILEKNDQIAEKFRNHLRSKNIFSINMLSSPGAGKTTIIERTVESLNSKMKISVIVGDIQTENDANRINKFGNPVVQIITHGACHLDAQLVKDAFENIEKHKTDFLIIENVGNLVCPAGFDLGEDEKVVVTSTTEGDDKPLKYPSAFRNASVMIINKVDLLPYVNCSIDLLRKNALIINPELRIFEISCQTNAGLDNWYEWINSKIKS